MHKYKYKCSPNYCKLPMWTEIILGPDRISKGGQYSELCLAHFRCHVEEEFNLHTAAFWNSCLSWSRLSISDLSGLAL